MLSSLLFYVWHFFFPSEPRHFINDGLVDARDACVPRDASSCTVRAHAEFDAVIGRARLPTYADYPHSPNIRAKLKAGPSLEKKPIH